MGWDAVARALERPLSVRSPWRPMDAIVVLGSPLGPRDTLTPVLAERAAAAIALWQCGGAKVVVTSGGITHGARRAEADVLADVILEAGLPVIIERASQTTEQNAVHTAALLHPLGVRSAWLVTQPFHGRRAARLFRAAGIEASAWHIDDSLQYRDRRRAVRWLLREYGAWGVLAARAAARRSGALGRR